MSTADEPLLDPLVVQPPPSGAPPGQRLPPRQWIRRNLAATPASTAVTIVFGAALGWAAWRLARFALVTADWEVVRRNLRLFVVGRFPTDELWRVWVAGYLIALTVGVAIGVAGSIAAQEDVAAGRAVRRATPRAMAARVWPVIALAVVLVGFTRTPLPGVLLAGAVATVLVGRVAGSRAPTRARRLVWFVVPVLLVGAFVVVSGFGGVSWDRWGGLLLTLFVAVAGVALAFPLGIVLALGRRSSLPAVRWLSIAYIELFRGVPLIAFLLMGQFMIGFLFPTTVEPPSFLARALIVIVLFQSAYLAEVVRGGLQAVGRGQHEAAQALGLPPRKVLRFVVLPQALRAVIPAVVGQFISLFKDTSLLAGIGFFELLNVAQAVVNQPDFQGRGLDAVTLGFIGFVFWVACYTMSRESRRLERRLGVGTR